MKRLMMSALVFACAGALCAQEIERVSVDDVGAEGNAASYSTRLSSNGRLVMFESEATNLIGAGDTNGVKDVFVYDRQAGTVERVSEGNGGVEGALLSDVGALSDDGRYAVFSTQSGNIVAGDTNGFNDVFVRDRQTGVVERVSVDNGGGEANGASGGADISGNGRYVAYVSGATNLVAGDTNAKTDVFVYDRQADSVERVSVDDLGGEGDGDSLLPKLSADGRYVAFQSEATSLLGVGNDNNGFRDVFVYDRQADTIVRVSVDDLGGEANADSVWPDISGDGRYVAFQSPASDLVAADTNGVNDVFVYDCQAGTIERVSVDDGGGEANAGSRYAAISADGRYVAYESSASDLVAGDTNGAIDIFVHDRQAGSVARVSVDSGGGEGNGNSEVPGISGDGVCVAFQSLANGLVGAADTNGVSDVFAVGDCSPLLPTPTETPVIVDHVTVLNNVLDPTRGGKMTICVKLERAMRVKVTIYDLTGAVIKKLVDEVKATSFDVAWEGVNAGRRIVSSGVYIVAIETEDWSETRKVIVKK